MDGFALLLGHLVGDFILTTDVLAENKSLPHPGSPPIPLRPVRGQGFTMTGAYACEGQPAQLIQQQTWWNARDWYYYSHLICLLHCLLYTLGVAAFTFWWMPWWGYVLCTAIHFPIDRWRLAGWWMYYVSRQRRFAQPPFSPWSVILIDQIFHLLTLYGLFLAARWAS